MYSILLVEDESSIRNNIQKGILWEKYGFYIMEAVSNGEEALEALEKIHPDILLTDIRMPFMDGLELSRIVKQLMPDVHIVILSGHMEFAYAKEAISIGVDEYLVKPITPVKVIRTFTALREKLDHATQVSEDYKYIVQRLRELEEQPDPKAVGKISVDDLVNEKDRDSMLWDFLQSGRLKDVETFTSEYLEFGGKKLLDSLLYCSYFFAQTIVTCVKEIELLGGNPKEILAKAGNIEEYAASAESTENVRKRIIDILHLVLEYRDQAVDRSNDIVIKAQEYIAAHYQDPELGSYDVAKYVGLSTSHFSYVFKQKTGCGFVRYLTGIRIDKAKELLGSTSLTTAEIAEQVGYSNPNYFSVVFHKIVGMPPSEFRP